MTYVWLVVLVLFCVPAEEMEQSLLDADFFDCLHCLDRPGKCVI